MENMDFPDGSVVKGSALPMVMDFPGGAAVKNLPAKAGDTRDAGLIPGYGRSPGGGHGNRLQYSCLENLVDRGAWRATVHGSQKNWTRLSTCIHTFNGQGTEIPHATWCHQKKKKKNTRFLPSSTL